MDVVSLADVRAFLTRGRLLATILYDIRDYISFLTPVVNATTSLVAGPMATRAVRLYSQRNPGFNSFYYLCERSRKKVYRLGQGIVVHGQD